MEFSYFSIGLYDENNSIINYLTSIINGKKEKKTSLSIADSSSFSSKCIESGELIIINDVSKEFPRYINEGEFNNQLKLNYNTDQFTYVLSSCSKCKDYWSNDNTK